MTIKWNLPNAMYQKGVFSASELRRLMKERVGYDISAPAVHRMVTGVPTEFKFATLDAICQALDCELSDVIVRQKPTVANQCVQPLVIGSDFKPIKASRKKSKAKELKMDLPPL